MHIHQGLGCTVYLVWMYHNHNILQVTPCRHNELAHHIMRKYNQVDGSWLYCKLVERLSSLYVQLILYIIEIHREIYRLKLLN